MHLTFAHDRPRWVRAYECRADGRITLMKDLQPHDKGPSTCEYIDAGNDVVARSARVYMFSRPFPLSDAGGSKEPPKAA